MNNNILSIRIEVPGLELLAEAIMKLAGGTASQAQPQMPIAPQAQPQMPIAPQAQPQMPIAPQAQPQMPIASQAQPQMPIAPQAQPQMPIAPQAQIPTTAVPVPYTGDELAVAASQLVNAGKQQRLFEILHGFGAASLMELPQDKYAAFAGCLKAEGVKF